MSGMGFRRISRPWLWLPSQWAHDWAPMLLPLAVPFHGVADKTWQPLQWKGLSFSNPIGLAGGVDKSGQSIKAWSELGAGFVEVGTVTPEPQTPNPGQIMSRDLKHGALWNKMGFPNPGALSLVKRLQSLHLENTPLFINVGKNRWTENAKASDDYGRCFELLAPFADVFVVNISSPNTKGLRDLFDESSLKSFLTQIQSHQKSFAPRTPTLLKLSPDMSDADLLRCLETSAPYVNGWILTNTTKSRYSGSPFPADQGGVSGGPLAQRSRQALQVVNHFRGENKEHLVVSVGGILSTADLIERLEGGADLVQTYSALVFHGPGFFKNCLNELRKGEP